MTEYEGRLESERQANEMPISVEQNFLMLPSICVEDIYSEPAISANTLLRFIQQIYEMPDKIMNDPNVTIETYLNVMNVINYFLSSIDDRLQRLFIQTF